MKKVEKSCPRCGDDYEMPIGVSGAISRADSETEICLRCGQDEGLRALMGLPPVGIGDWPVEEEKLLVEDVGEQAADRPVYSRVTVAFVLRYPDMAEAQLFGEMIARSTSIFPGMREHIVEAEVERVQLVQAADEEEGDAPDHE